MNSSSIAKRTLPLIIVLVVIIIIAVSCTLIGKEKSNPTISNENAYYVTITDGDKTYGISNKTIYESLKKYYGSTVLSQMMDKDLLTDVDGVNYMDILQADIDARLVKNIFGSQEEMDKLTVDEQETKRADYYELQKNNGLNSEEEIFNSVKLTLAKENYAKDLLEKEFLEKEGTETPMFTDTSISNYYDANYQDEYWTIIVVYPTKDLATTALKQLNVEVKEVTEAGTVYDRWVWMDDATWVSSNEAIATVDPATGLVTAVSAGIVDITYTTTSSKTATYKVNVHTTATPEGEDYYDYALKLDTEDSDEETLQLSKKLTLNQILKVHIDLYNSMYASNAENYPNNADPILNEIIKEDVHYTIDTEGNIVFNTTLDEEDEDADVNLLHKTYTELSGFNSTIASYLESTLNVFSELSEKDNINTENYTKYFVVNPTLASSQYYFSVKIKVDEAQALYDEAEGEEEAVMNETIKAEIIAKLKEEQVNETYINGKMADLRRDNGLLIYDKVVEDRYINNFDSKLKTTKKSSSTVVATVNGVDYTTDQLFDKMQAMFGTDAAIEKLQFEMILRDTNLNKIYDYSNYDNKSDKNRVLDATEWNSIKSTVIQQKRTFSQGGFEGYSPSMGWTDFMKEYFNVESEDELKLKVLYTVLVDDLADSLGKVTDETTIDDETWEFYYDAMDERVRDYYEVTGFHLLIGVYEDGNENGMYDDGSETDVLTEPKEWTAYQKGLVEELYDEVITMLEGTEAFDYQNRLVNFETDFKASPKFLANTVQDSASQPYQPGGVNDIYKYSKYKSAGITVMYQDLGTFSNGSMVPEFDEAARFIWQRKYDFEALGFGNEKEINIYTKAEALDGGYLSSEFGYHVYVNTGWTAPTKYYAEGENDGVTLPTSEYLLGIVKKYITDPTDPSLTTDDKNVITKFYLPIASEFKGEDDQSGGNYKYIEILRRQLDMNIEFASDSEAKVTRYLNKVTEYKNSYVDSLSYLLPVFEITNKEDMTVGGTLALDLNIISAFNFENEEVKWTSSNEDIATVDEFGVVTAVSAGKVVITASSEIQQSLSASAVIRITQPPV